MSDDLKPCPWCGVGVRAMSRYHPRDPNEWYVSCGARDCVMQPETPTYRTDDEAIAAWNRRPDTRREALEEAAQIVQRMDVAGLSIADMIRQRSRAIAAIRVLQEPKQ